MRKSDAVAPLRNQKHIEARLRPFLRFILLQIALKTIVLKVFLLIGIIHRLLLEDCFE